MSVRRVALLTAGGFAPCLSSAVGGLIERYTEIDPTVEIIAYQNGYHGLLTGNYVVVDEDARAHAAVLHRFGGSPIGNSRVKLTNKKNLVERGLVAEDENPLEKAAEQLRKDGVDVLLRVAPDLATRLVKERLLADPDPTPGAEPRPGSDPEGPGGGAPSSR